MATPTPPLLRPDDPAYDTAVALQVRKRGPNLLRGVGIPVTDEESLPAAARTVAATLAHIVLIDRGARISQPG